MFQWADKWVRLEWNGICIGMPHGKISKWSNQYGEPLHWSLIMCKIHGFRRKFAGFTVNGKTGHLISADQLSAELCLGRFNQERNDRSCDQHSQVWPSRRPAEPTVVIWTYRTLDLVITLSMLRKNTVRWAQRYFRFIFAIVVGSLKSAVSCISNAWRDGAEYCESPGNPFPRSLKLSNPQSHHL